MIPDDLAQWGDDFETFHARFARFFKRSESRQQAVKYVRGLMAPVQRKNGWQLAAAAGDETPDKMQRLLYRSDWDVDGVRDELQAFVVERVGDAAGGGVVNETGFIKKGTHSVGVQRQYSEEGKGETGLDDYEVRFWDSWYRHVTRKRISQLGIFSGPPSRTWLLTMRRLRVVYHQRARGRTLSSPVGWRRSFRRYA